MVSQRHGVRLPRGGGMLLLPAAAVAVHQLRYSLAYGGRANAELAAQGHSYLHSLVPWTILALAVAGGSFLRRLALVARSGERTRIGRLSAGAVWLATWVALVGVYAAQETLESLIASGHPGGLSGVVGHGGWWAVPAAAAVAAVVTAILLLGRVLLRIAAAAPVRRRAALAVTRMPASLALAAGSPIARAAAGRAPPASPRSR